MINIRKHLNSQQNIPHILKCLSHSVSSIRVCDLNKASAWPMADESADASILLLSCWSVRASGRIKPEQCRASSNASIQHLPTHSSASLFTTQPQTVSQQTVNKQTVYHRLHDSGSTAVTMTSKVNGKMEILTQCRSETPKSIETKIGLNDYVIDLQLCQFLWKSVQRGLLPN